MFVANWVDINYNVFSLALSRHTLKKPILSLEDFTIYVSSKTFNYNFYDHYAMSIIL